MKIDIKRMYLNRKQPDDITLIIMMVGDLAELMCELDSRLIKHESGIIYLSCIKVLYGHIEVASYLWTYYRWQKEIRISVVLSEMYLRLSPKIDV